ncbi:MAG TPA: Ig-like domain-containing protein, partial [Planctomycetota bacterium]|nr:Ig-like domain-containing protein [Planctomycetota bacterium]
MRDRIRVLAALLFLTALAPSASAEDECAVGEAPDRLAALAAAVDAALPGASTRAESRALTRARDALAGRGASFVSRTNALRIAVLALDRVPGRLLHDDRRDACDALLADVDGEVRDLQEVFTIFPGAATDRARARIAVLAARAEAALQEGRTARAATELHRTARAIERAREPRVETYGGALRVISVNLDGVGAVHLNRPVVIQFSARLDPESARADTIQVRRGPNYSAQVAGSYEVRGPMVVFRPRLPTLADLSDSGLQGNTGYRVVIPGYPSVATVRSDRGKPHAKLFTADFHTSIDPSLHFTASEYLDAPPPRVACTVPADVLPAAPWSDPAGAVEVPVASPIRLVLNRVPLLPSTLTPDSVRLVMTEFRGVPASVRIPGRAVLDQDLSRVTLTFVPDFQLPDRSRFALRVDRSVTDLTGQFELADHEGRAAISAQAAVEYETTPSGPLATLAQEHPLEVDPRTFLVFTTRDEAASDLDRSLAFDGTDVDVYGGNGVDPGRTTASFDDAVPGAVAGTLTVAGGDGRLGVLDPPFSIELDTDSPEAPGGVFEYQRIHIRPGITVSFRGSRPAILRAREDAVVEGALVANGSVGANAEVSQGTDSLPVQVGGAGGPGGGAGGDSFPGPEFGMRGGSGAGVPSGGTGGQ